MKKKFVICSFRSTNGGPIVLEMLCKLLIEAGCDARMFYMKDEMPRYVPVFSGHKAFESYYEDYHKFEQRMLRRSHYWETTGEGYEEQYQPYIYHPAGKLPVWEKTYVDNDTIVVYPEVIPGNILEAKNVVRWLLYHYKYSDGLGTAYQDTDLFIAYREIYNDWKLNPKGYILNMIYYNSDLYQNKGYPNRQGECYIIRKGDKRKDLPSLDGKLIIDNKMESEIADIFNRVKRCISYDTQTFYSSLAALCGCESIVVPEPGKKRSDYKKGEDESFGIAFGDTPEELSYAKRTLPLLKENILQKMEENRRQVKNFLSLCNEYFSSR